MSVAFWLKGTAGEEQPLRPKEEESLKRTRAESREMREERCRGPNIAHSYVLYAFPKTNDLLRDTLGKTTLLPWNLTTGLYNDILEQYGIYNVDWGPLCVEKGKWGS